MRVSIKDPVPSAVKTEKRKKKKKSITERERRNMYSQTNGNLLDFTAPKVMPWIRLSCVCRISLASKTSLIKRLRIGIQKSQTSNECVASNDNN
jgi:hypothetical protein